VERLFLVLMALIAFLPLYFTPNPGYDPWLKEYNIWTWVVVAVLILIAAVKSGLTRTLVLPRQYLWFLLLPVGLCAGTLINGVPYPADLLFRMSYVCAGVAFLFAIYQYAPSRRIREDVMIIFAGATFLFSIVSILQIIPGQILLGWIPHMTTPRIIGSFQHANVNASAILTGVLLSIYLLSLPGLARRNVLVKAVCLLTILLGSIIVVSSGSRSGLLAAIVSLPIMLLSRVAVFYRRKITAALILIALGVGVGIGVQDPGALARKSLADHRVEEAPAEVVEIHMQHERLGAFAAGGAGATGIERTIWKFKRMLQGGAGEIRPYIYMIALDVMGDSPLYGQGIGAFQSVFHERAAEYMAARGGERLIGTKRLDHPHNELLLWGVEGGALAVLAILAVAVVVLIALYRLGWQRGGALFALLLPITLHTQVELPFYTSVYHWLLFIFILYLVLSSRGRDRVVRVSKTAVVMPVMLGAALCSAVVVYFCILTIPVSRDLNYFFTYKQLDMKKLEAAGRNLYFGEFATMLKWKVLLNQDLRNRTNHWTREYIRWAETYVQKVPEITTIHAIALAYRNLGMTNKAMETLNRGLYLYPGNKSLSGLYRQMLTGK